MLRNVLPYTEQHYARALVMPNIDPPVVTVNDVLRYRDEIAVAQTTSFLPLMTIKITPWTTPATVIATRDAGVVAGKLYPEGVTTGADVGGVSDFRAMWPVFRAMEDTDMVLCLHGELPSSSVLDRENAFLPELRDIAEGFPRLRIVLEHVSTAAAVDAVRSLENVSATITAHHLLLTIDDLLSDRGLQPHHYCKPVVKTSHDRDVLIEAAVTGDRNFFFGSDSAPHSREKKEADCAPAGVFSSPVAMSILAAIFEQAGALSALEGFTSEFGAQFYGLPLTTGHLELRRETWTVPRTYGRLVPLCAGTELFWRVVE
jgi:dihydroorotase